MAVKSITLTQEGLDHLKAELKELKEVKKPEVIGRIKQAKEFGDLSENSEYQSAKEDQSFFDSRILEIESMLKVAKVVEKNQNSSIIGLGSKIVVDIEGDSLNYEIVGPTEGDLELSKISSESPVGKALLGHQKGDKVTVMAPGGDVEYKIVSVG